MCGAYGAVSDHPAPCGRLGKSRKILLIAPPPMALGTWLLRQGFTRRCQKFSHSVIVVKNRSKIFLWDRSSGLSDAFCGRGSKVFAPAKISLCIRYEYRGNFWIFSIFQVKRLCSLIMSVVFTPSRSAHHSRQYEMTPSLVKRAFTCHT